jgi:dephospho-CoA kinase
MAKIIGLTGMYCAGKNCVASLLEDRGFPVLDVDKLGHEAIEAGKEAIIRRFGSDVLIRRNTEDEADRQRQTVDRRKLGEKVFGNPQGLADLEAIVHPEANRLTEKWIQNQNGKTCVINAALLHKSSAFEKLDCIIIVEAPFFDRLRRARQRDHLSWITLLKRFGSQKKFKAQYLCAKADIYRIDNRGYSPHEFPQVNGELKDRIGAILSGEGIH